MKNRFKINKRGRNSVLIDTIDDVKAIYVKPVKLETMEEKIHLQEHMFDNVGLEIEEWQKINSRDRKLFKENNYEFFRTM